MRRHGYALLAVLWVLVATSLLALGTALSAREAMAGARNRLAIDRARWQAEGCLAVARAIIDSALAASPSWPLLDQLHLDRRITGCLVRLEPAGIRLDINSADVDHLERALRGARIAAEATDSLVQALQDWRDPDDAPRPLGAERRWYDARRRPPPRNGPFADTKELRRVRGFEHAWWVDSILTTEPGRVAVLFAPAAVIAALPGITPEAAAAIMARRDRGDRINSLGELADWLPATARDSLGAGMSDLVRIATVAPDAWLLSVIAPAGLTAPRATVELRLAAAGSRAAIVRQRDW